MELIFGSEKKKIMKKLQYYGISEVPYLLIKFGENKIRGYSGALSTEEIREIEQEINIEIMGLYLFDEYDDSIKLSLEGVHTFKNQISKNIIELDEKEAEDWFKGNDLAPKEKLKKEPAGFKVLKHKGEFIGSGKLTENRLINYTPRERRQR